MVIEVKSRIFVTDSVTNNIIIPSQLNIDNNELIKYMVNHPLPKDNEYELLDLFRDLKWNGPWEISTLVSDEICDWIADMVMYFISLEFKKEKNRDYDGFKNC